MADFTYASYTTYMPPFFGDPDTWMRHIHNDAGGVITDPVNGVVPRIRDNDTFEPSETVTIQTSPDSTATLSYEGTVVIGGTLYPVFEDAFGNIYVFSQTIDPLPATLDITTLNENDPFEFPVCFAAGTRIATPEGACVVERLRIGDRVLTADGRAVAVRWIGRQTVLPMFSAEDRLPVVIAAGALGPGTPQRALMLSADHALLLDGLLINAGALANGDNIRRLERSEVPQELHYYNIETDAHEALLAEGAAAESFVDYRGRDTFDNVAEYRALYGVDRPIREMPLPRIARASLVPRPILAAIAKRAGAASETAA